MIEERSRRLTAVMFTDVVGYTTMMQEDEEVALNARRRHREALERIVSEAGGEVLQFFGDGGLSIFPSSVNAVKAATELQQTFREEPEVPVRIGIHQGDVELDEFGPAGDAVNIASRIESLSPPGGVLISEKVFAEVRNQPNIDTASLGLFHFKNVGEPIQLHAVQGGSLTVPERDQLGGPTGEPIRTRAKTLAFLPLLAVGGLLVLAIAALVSAQSTGADFGVLSYLGTWAAFAGGLWFLFDKTEKAVSPVVRRSASAWLRNIDPAAVAARWPSLFAAAFDKLFGEKHWSWKCFRRSAVASVLSVGHPVRNLLVDLRKRRGVVLGSSGRRAIPDCPHVGSSSDTLVRGAKRSPRLRVTAPDAMGSPMVGSTPRLGSSRLGRRGDSGDRRRHVSRHPCGLIRLC